MSQLIQMLMVVIALGFVVKQSLGNKWQWLAGALLNGSLIWILKPFALQQSKTAMESLLSNPEIMTNLSLFVIVDCSILMTYCFKNAGEILNNIKAGDWNKNIWRNFLKIYPGFLVVPMLYFALSHAFFLTPGVSFTTVTWVVTVVVVLLSGFAPYLTKIVLPNNDIRRELLVIICIIIACIGIVGTVNGTTVYKNMNKIDWGSLLWVSISGIVVAGMGAIGWVRKVEVLVVKWFSRKLF